MIISGFDKVSILNYPGEVACTIFTNGCNFKCPYCQNSGLVLGTDQTRYEEEEILAYLKKEKVSSMAFASVVANRPFKKV